MRGSVSTPFLLGSATIVFEYVSGDNWIQLNLGKLLSGRIDAALDSIADSWSRVNYYVIFLKQSTKSLKLIKEYNEAGATGKYSEQVMINKFINKESRRLRSLYNI